MEHGIARVASNVARHHIHDPAVGHHQYPAATVALPGTYHNLLRLWADT